MPNTFQSNIKGSSDDNPFNQITNYSLFVGGLDTKRDVLNQYQPLKTGFARLFMIKKPQFLANSEYNKKLTVFKHFLEYGNIAVQGNNNITMNFNQYNGGFVNRQLDMPNIAVDDTNELTISVYEYTGSPIREIIQLWINGVSDLRSGHAHYYGSSLPVCPANHTAEFIYATTDPTGLNVEYAAYFTNCFPKEIKFDHFNYEAGTHDIVRLDLIFTCARHISPAVNVIADRLVKKYAVIVNSLYYNSNTRSQELHHRDVDGHEEYGKFYDPYGHTEDGTYVGGDLSKIEETGRYYSYKSGGPEVWSNRLGLIKADLYGGRDTINKSSIKEDMRKYYLSNAHQTIYGDLLHGGLSGLNADRIGTYVNPSDKKSQPDPMKPDEECPVIKSTGYRGDADGSGNIDNKDADTIAKYLAHGKKDNLPPDADFNRDGKIDIRDAAAIARYIKNGGSKIKGDPTNDRAVTYHDAQWNAEMLAKGKGSEIPTLQGDFNGDGKVDIRDSAALSRYLKDGGTKIVGDVNNDGKRDTDDLEYLSSMISHGKASELNQNADVNGDGKINISDSAALERLIKE